MKTGWKTFIVAFVFFVLRLAVALVFIYAGAVKMIDPGEFLSQILGMQVVPYWMAYTIAHFVPCVEVVAGFLLMTFSFTCAASVILAFLTLTFILFLTLLHLLDIENSCGCFGDLVFKSFYAHITMNSAILIALAAHFTRMVKIQLLMEDKN
jgi:putative oxidoreductase